MTDNDCSDTSGINFLSIEQSYKESQVHSSHLHNSNAELRPVTIPPETFVTFQNPVIHIQDQTPDEFDGAQAHQMTVIQEDEQELHESTNTIVTKRSKEVQPPRASSRAL